MTANLWSLSLPLEEIILRGSVMYWFLFTLFRFVLRRDIGSMSVSDFLFVAIVADASQNAMSADAKSIADGLVLVTTLIAWNFILDYLSYHFPVIKQFTEPSPVLLVKNGAVLWRNLRKEFITREELQAKLREHGLEGFENVKEMRLEADGEISVILH